MGEDWPPLPLYHDIPHGRDRRLAAAFVGNLSIIRDEVKLTASVAQATLLDFMAAHGVLTEMGARSGGYAHAKGPPGAAERRVSEM